MTRQNLDDADAGAAAAADDEAALPGTLRAQTGPRTTAPMWPRPLMTEGEWAIYTAIWSFGNWSGLEAIPSYQKIADRAFAERGSVMNAVAKFTRWGLMDKEHRHRPDKSQKSNGYVLVEVCPDALLPELMRKIEDRMADQAAKKAKRDADKRRYRKAKRDGDADALAAETTASEDGPGAGIEGGSLHSDPPQGDIPDWARDKGGSPQDDPRGSLHDDPRGSSANDPLTYPVFDLPNVEKSPSTASVTHAADAPASGADEAPAELAEEAPAPAPVPAVGGKFSPEDQNQLTTAVDAAVEARRQRTGWARPAVVAAVVEALDAGHPVAVVVAELGRLARDLDGTDYPTRLPGWIAAGVRTGRIKTPTPATRPAAPCPDGCRCWKHTPAQIGPSEETAAALAAVRATLPPGKPLSRRSDWTPAPRTPAPAESATGDLKPESAPAPARA